MARKIAIIGSECCGKTTLARYLASCNKGSAFVSEYLRYFCSKYNPPVNAKQQHHIAHKQISIEMAVFLNRAVFDTYKNDDEVYHSLIFCDTTPLLTYVYGLYYLNYDDDYLLHLARNHHDSYDKTILLHPAVWYRQKGMRDSPEAQLEVYNLLVDVLDRYNVKYEKSDYLDYFNNSKDISFP